MLQVAKFILLVFILVFILQSGLGTFMKAPPKGPAFLLFKLLFSKWGLWVDHFTRNKVCTCQLHFSSLITVVHVIYQGLSGLDRPACSPGFDLSSCVSEQLTSRTLFCTSLRCEDQHPLHIPILRPLVKGALVLSRASKEPHRRKGCSAPTHCFRPASCSGAGWRRRLPVLPVPAQPGCREGADRCEQKVLHAGLTGLRSHCHPPLAVPVR